MIENMRKGLKNKKDNMTIPKIIVRGIIKQLQDLILENTYENKFNNN